MRRMVAVMADALAAETLSTGAVVPVAGRRGKAGLAGRHTWEKRKTGGRLLRHRRDMCTSARAVGAR